MLVGLTISTSLELFSMVLFLAQPEATVHPERGTIDPPERTLVLLLQSASIADAVAAAADQSTVVVVAAD